MERTKYTPKRLLSLLLALIMLLGMFPTAVFAAQPNGNMRPSYRDVDGVRFEITSISCVNPLSVSELGNVSVDVHWQLKAVTSNVHAVHIGIDANNMLQIGGQNVAYSGGNQLNEFIASESGNYAANQIIAEGDVTGATGTLKSDHTITVSADAGTISGLQLNQQKGSNTAVKFDAVLENVELDKYIVSFAGDFKGQLMSNEMLLTSGEVTLPDLGESYTEKDYTFKGWLNEVTHAVQTGTVTVTKDTTFTAVWEAAQPKEYTITFLDAKDGKVFTTVPVTEGKCVMRPDSIPEAPEADKVFAGWYFDGMSEDAEGNVSTVPVKFDFGHAYDTDMTVYAQWKDATKTHTVTFMSDVAGVSQLPAARDVAHGTKTTAPTETPLRDGYVFDGFWYRVTVDATTGKVTSGTVFNFETETVTEDITLVPGWTREKVNIAWPAVPAGVTNIHHTGQSDVGGNGSRTNAAKGSTVNFTVTLAEGYQFNQGDVQVDGVPLGWTIKENTNKTTTYYFSFVANAEPKANETEATMTVTINAPSKKTFTIGLPQGDGYWASFVDCSNSKANNATYFVFEYGDTFKIKLESDPDVAATLYVDGETVATTDGLNKLTDTSKEFTIKSDLTIRATGKRRIERTVVFTLQPYSGQYMQLFVDNGTALRKPTDPEIPGYEFVSWYQDEAHTTLWNFLPANYDTLSETEQKEAYSKATKVNRNTTIYGLLKVKTYEIKYEANKPANAQGDVTKMPTSPAATKKTHGTPFPIDNATPELEGYIFKGWATSETGPVAYQPGEQYLIDADLTLYAVWAKKTYTVTVSSGAGYSTVPAGINPVEWNDNFTFTVTVDREYAATAPKVEYQTKEGNWVEITNSTPADVTKPHWVSGTTSNNSAAAWVYMIPGVKENYSVRITVARNEIHQVSYFVAKGDKNGDTFTNVVVEDTAFLIQSVEHGYYASMPATPERSGYEFDHWERYHLVNGTLVKDETDDNNQTLANNAVFTKAITEDGVQFRAVYKKIVPTITIVNKDNICEGETHKHTGGFGLEKWAHDSTKSPVYSDTNKAAIDANGEFTITYGDSVAFDLVIDEGYDYSQLSVTANGISMGLGDSITETDGKTTIHYVLGHVTGDTRISVANIKRKTITINYFANAGDDVAQVPGPQTGVKYYIDGATNDTISSFEPKRNGYTFLGWCEVPTGTEVKANGKLTGYTVGETTYPLYQPGDTAAFTKDTNLYAIWEAADLTVDLLISDKFIDYTSNSSNYKKLDYAYEGEKIYLTGKLGEKAQGTMTFYKHQKTAPDTEWTVIGTVTVNGGLYGTIETTAEAYQWDHVDNGPNNKYRWDYKVEFTPTNEEGYKECKAQDDLRVYSKAISWELNKNDTTKWTLKDEKANQLTVYTNEARTEKADNGVMVAGKTYWLQIPNVVELDGGLALENKKNYEENGNKYTEGYPKSVNVGEHYEIVWEYEDSKDHWKTFTTTSDTDWVKITEEYSGYSFRAKVTPTKVGIYDKAATYDEKGTVVKNVYWDYLITEPTEKTAREDTAITLEVNTDDESNSVMVNGENPFLKVEELKDEPNGFHKAQYEYQTIDLVAKVTKTDTGKTAIGMGTVEFFRKNAKGEWESLGTAAVQPDGENTGVASIEYTMPTYDTKKDATGNVETFKAVYLQNETYDTSSVDGAKAYIKSAELQTPVIESALKGELKGADTATLNGKTEDNTYYDYDLVNLLAGVKHTFTLRQTGAAVTADEQYSVVALDGRTVEAGDYDIQWIVKTGDNEETNAATGASFSTSNNKDGDYIYVKLIGKNNMTNEAASRLAVIGKLQGVVVTVVAIDAIPKTDETDVYQLNDITLTATVAAAEGDNSTMKPTGKVAFYYYDDTAKVYKYLDEAKLEESTDGKMVAKITTNELPVDPTSNTYRNVTITAVYFGDATFMASAEATKTGETYQIEAVQGCKTTDDTVTVYSSVVYNCEEHENTLTTEKLTDKGIHISVSDGVFKTNNEATLKLSDIYTLDCTATGLSADMLKLIAKLDPNSDYEIQWQKLTGAKAYTDPNGIALKDSDRWKNIDGEKNGTITLIVEQDTAYRAVITVKDQPITKGSFTEVDQEIDGRKAYYSNILMPTDASITMSVMVNTSDNGANEEGITEGETVTANVFLSGVTGSVPNAEIEVLIEADAKKGNTEAYTKSFTKATVNGWNSVEWDTKDVQPGFYTMKITAKTNTGYATKEFTRSIIVRESSYDFNIGNTTTTYNGQTQGVTVTLNGFDFKGNDINEAAKKSWTVKYYDKDGNLVEPSQAGTYKAVVTLPGSAYWTEKVSDPITFTIEKREVSIADAVAQAKVYDGTDNVNIVEVILNDAETEQTTTGLSTNDIGIINGDSVYAVATEKKLGKADAGDNSFTISKIELRGDDAANYVWNGAVYTEDIYVSRSQVYGETAALLTGTNVSLKLKKGEDFPADEVIKMIDQAGNVLTFGKGYTLTFYYHSDTQIKQTKDLSQLGLYTVVARPNQSNYKSGVTMKFEVVDGETKMGTLNDPKPSTLIYISDTATKYNPAGNAAVTAKNAQGKDVTVEYQDATNSTGWSNTVPANAGRYLVRATDTDTGDVAYGIYTITKAHPTISVAAANATYNSKPYTGATTDVTDYYLTYAGDVAIGFDKAEDGNVAEQAPVDAGDYVVTLHVNETQNYTAHEVSAPFTIAKKALTIRADSRKTTQYDAFPTMTATYDGLAAETDDDTPDTSLRDVQIAPEFLYNPTNDKPNYSNDSLDQNGRVAVEPIDALSKNYAITYVNGEYVKSATESNPDLEILGLPQSGEKVGNKYVAKVYYGDEVQLYPYGNYTKWANNSSEYTWSVDTTGITKGEVKIDATNGLLTVGGVGTFTVTLKRGADEQQIETSVTVTAIQKEVQIALKEVDKVYSGSEQFYEMSNITVHDELYRALANFDGKLTTSGLKRTNIGTQIPTAKVTGAWSSQSETYGGQFSIHDKEATVAPKEDSHTYGQTRTIPNPAYTVDEANAIKDVLTASQTDVYDRLDVHDGYEILVAGTEDINYNVKYTTDHDTNDAEDSKVEAFQNVVFTSKTIKELNDATVYGETPNALDWELKDAQFTKRSTEQKEYKDNLADFDLPEIFVYQVYDNCVGNADCGKFDYKAANRTTTVKPVAYNQAVLIGPRHSTPNTLFENLIKLNNNPLHNEVNGLHPNYTLFFNVNGVSEDVKNYTMNDKKVGNASATTNALRANSLGYSVGNDTLVKDENFVEGSANIAQRPVKVEKDTNLGTVTLYWKLPQKDLYTALLNILKAEATDDGRGLAKGHTIEDLDLIFKIEGKEVSPTSTAPMDFTKADTKTVTLTIGDTNYVLEGDGKFEVDFEAMRIRAYYYNKTFTGFNVRIQKIGANSEPAGPLTSTKGLTFKVLKETNGVLNTETDYATNKIFRFDSNDSSYGYFTGTYNELPLLGAGELYVFQLYEYGVPLERK